MSTNSIDAGHLRSFIERIERLSEEKKALAEDIADVYSEAKGTGYDVKIMRKIVALRKQDSQKRAEEEEILDLYLSALGEKPFGGTPLGNASGFKDEVSTEVRKAAAKLGTPAPLTEEEKAKGYTAAFIGKDGTRMTVGLGVRV